MTAYYNEHDAEKAAWIRELIRRNTVAPGDVDERSIADVRADDLRGYTQCHFFAGIAVWSYALRLAGWPDDRPVWTGSCPCPSFSCAGKGEGFDDPRHLWPVWFPLIRERRPGVLFGEQSHDAIRFGWLDLVQSDMEAENYAFAPAVLGAHSVGAGHKRQRLYFCADSMLPERRPISGTGKDGRDRPHSGRQEAYGQPRTHSEARLSADSDGRFAGDGDLQRSGEQRLLAEDCGTRVSANPEQRGRHDGRWRGPGWFDPLTARSVAAAGATRGFWGDCDWWHARDGKYRPIERGLFPLAHGTSNRVLKLRGYGDAIIPQVAQAFIESYLETRKEL
jgi:DNA (cytosine-5)-methyltransferase 1